MCFENSGQTVKMEALPSPENIKYLPLYMVYIPGRLEFSSTLL
jgi:hypothetical protein